jgi:hypothetical protein
MDDKDKTESRLIAELKELQRRLDQLAGRSDVAGAARDAIERARSEDTLQISEERFRTLCRGSPVPMLLFQWQNDDLVLIDCNASTISSSKGRMSELLGSGVKHIFADEPEVPPRLHACYAGRTSIQLEICHQFWETDELLYTSVFAAFIPPDLLVIQAQDITKFRELEAELLKANELLREERPRQWK